MQGAGGVSHVSHHNDKGLLLRMAERTPTRFTDGWTGHSSVGSYDIVRLIDHRHSQYSNRKTVTFVAKVQPKV